MKQYNSLYIVFLKEEVGQCQEKQTKNPPKSRQAKLSYNGIKSTGGQIKPTQEEHRIDCVKDTRDQEPSNQDP